MNTEIFNEINWIAVSVAAVAYFALGAIWYSFLFGKQWIKYSEVDVNAPDAKKGAALTMFRSFVMMFICSLGIAVLAGKMDLAQPISGLKLGALTGICFSATAIHISYLYEKRPVGLHLINAGYNILGNILAGVIICAMQ
ncbi:DUF1761 domain-containing protein [soil metagenome]